MFKNNSTLQGTFNPGEKNKPNGFILTTLSNPGTKGEKNGFVLNHYSHFVHLSNPGQKGQRNGFTLTHEISQTKPKR